MRSNATGRAERAARNEVTFREVNETLREGLREGGIAPNEEAAFVCECSSTDCTEMLTARLGDIETVRASRDRFVVRPGHELTAVERVVAHRPGYLIVEKLDIGEVRAIVEKA